MGSGNNIKLAIKKYGIENFTKTILHIFNCIKECYDKESEIVNESFIERNDTYNISLGGLHGPVMIGEKHPLYGMKSHEQSIIMTEQNPSRLPHVRKMLSETKVVKDGNSYKRVCKNNKEYENINTGKVTMRDSSGNCLSVSVDDKRIISGELEHVTKGRFKAKDKDGNMYFISEDDERFLRGELVGFKKDIVKCMNFSGKTVYTTLSDERFLSGELLKRSRRHFTAIDLNGVEYYVTPEDERYINGELRRNKNSYFIAIDKELNTYNINKNDSRYITGMLTTKRKGVLYECPFCKFKNSGLNFMKINHFNNCKI